MYIMHVVKEKGYLRVLFIKTLRTPDTQLITTRASKRRCPICVELQKERAN